MRLISESELATLVSRDRRTVSASLAGRILPTPGPHGAHLYPSDEALAILYQIQRTGCTLDEAKRQQAESAAKLNETRNEILRKARVPLVVVAAIWDALLTSLSASLKASKGQLLTVEKINQLLENLRTAPLQISKSLDIPPPEV